MKPRKRVRRNKDNYYNEFSYDNYDLTDSGLNMNNSYSDDYCMFDYCMPGLDETIATGEDNADYVDYDYSGGGTREVAADVKKGIKKDLMNAVGSVVDVVVSPESLLQMSDAISSFTATGEDMDEDTQTFGADIARRMTGNLLNFTGESDKEQMGKIGGKVMNGLSGMVGSSTPDTSVLMQDALAGKEPNFDKLAEMDRNPKEDEYFRKLARLKV